jgi:hypothetical protein
VPPEFVTVTSTVPLPAGEVAVIDVALLTVNEVAGVPPNRTAFAPVKLLPAMIMGVPPAAGPLFGEIEVTDGGRTCAWTSRLVKAIAATSAATIMPAARIVQARLRIATMARPKPTLQYPDLLHNQFVRGRSQKQRPALTTSAIVANLQQASLRSSIATTP